ncbi:LysR family transcriptional regulator [Hydrogenophaga sp. YM1]|uniref:LysR family transcriptional regulator n=1 Tax=Hydrogenophaga sp. YM1 TaxID=2806262 RepID=UPI00195C60BC|nr:LysR family transcriptional regulator [Hydrogenophaga sp. YM1]QRR34617.1 LysR family transcriptional regulator [Hydrogenophaga sp. YM1]
MSSERALRYFLTVVRTGSIRRAADQLYVAASAISRQIADLEEHYGAPLLERIPRGVVATEAGRVVLEHALHLAQSEADLRARLLRLQGAHEGVVRIICGSGWEADLMRNGLRAFAAAHPLVTWRVAIGPARDILDSLFQGDADIGLLFDPPATEGLESLMVVPGKMHALLPVPEYAEVRGPKWLRELAHVPAAVHPEGYTLRHALSQIEANERFRLHIQLETESADLRFGFANAGLGMLIAPVEISREYPGLREGRLAAVELLDPQLRNACAHLLVRAGRKLPEAVASLVEILSTRMAAFRR